MVRIRGILSLAVVVAVVAVAAAAVVVDGKLQGRAGGGSPSTSKTLAVARAAFLPSLRSATQSIFAAPPLTPLGLARAGSSAVLAAPGVADVVRVELRELASDPTLVVDRNTRLVPVELDSGARYLCALPRTMAFPEQLAAALDGADIGQLASEDGAQVESDDAAEAEAAPAVVVKDKDKVEGEADDDEGSLLERWGLSAADIEAVLAPLNGRCLLYEYGWWKYKLCMGRYLRQWHDSAQDYKLGVYNADESAETQLAEVESHLDSAALRGVDPATALPGLWKPSYLTQIYDSGTACDVTGQPRRTELVFSCKPSVPSASLAHIEELRTCEYRIRIHTALVCRPRSTEETGNGRLVGSEPATPSTTRIRTIRCAPVETVA